MSLISFGYAQVIYSLTLIVGYYGYFVLEIWSGKNKELTSVKQLLPALPGNNRGPIFDPKLIGLSLSFLWQSFQKLILQEAEKVILKSVTSLVNQGIFGVVNFFGKLKIVGRSKLTNFKRISCRSIFIPTDWRGLLSSIWKALIK